MGQISSDDLGDDILVAESNNEAIFGARILILVLCDQTLTGVVISLAFSAPSELHLVALKVSFILYDMPYFIF